MAKFNLGRSCLALLTIVAAASVAAAQLLEDTTSKTEAGPKITSVSKITTSEHQTITIKGTGFGTHDAYKGDSDYISLLDLTKKWEAGYKPDDDTVTLIVEKWENTEIVLGGFAGKWGTSDFTLAAGNEEWVRVWNAQTKAGPASVKLKISGAETKTAVTSTTDSSFYREPVTFTALVTHDAGVPPDGETVLFMSGTELLGKGTLSGGLAHFTTSALEVGTHTIRAVYSGDSQFAKSASGDADSGYLIQTVH
jgi:Bacterial Ig-like domain (group 3)